MTEATKNDPKTTEIVEKSPEVAMTSKDCTDDQKAKCLAQFPSMIEQGDRIIRKMKVEGVEAKWKDLVLSIMEQVGGMIRKINAIPIPSGVKVSNGEAKWQATIPNIMEQIDRITREISAMPVLFQTDDQKAKCLAMFPSLMEQADRIISKMDAETFLTSSFSGVKVSDDTLQQTAVSKVGDLSDVDDFSDIDGFSDVD